MSATRKTETAKPETVARKPDRRGIRHGLTAGELPKGCEYLENKLNAFRRLLEDAVQQSRGEITLTDAAAIQSVLRWERHAQLAQRWLRVADDKLSPETKLSFSREIAKASSERDKALKLLDLDRDESQDLWSELYAPRISHLGKPDETETTTT